MTAQSETLAACGSFFVHRAVKAKIFVCVQNSKNFKNTTKGLRVIDRVRCVCEVVSTVQKRVGKGGKNIVRFKLLTTAQAGGTISLQTYRE